MTTVSLRSSSRESRSSWQKSRRICEGPGTEYHKTLLEKHHYHGDNITDKTSVLFFVVLYAVFHRNNRPIACFFYISLRFHRQVAAVSYMFLKGPPLKRECSVTIIYLDDLEISTFCSTANTFRRSTGYARVNNCEDLPRYSPVLLFT